MQEKTSVALIGWLSGKPPVQVTIVGRGSAGGYVEREVEEDKIIYTRSELEQMIAGSGLRVTSVAAVYEGESYADVAAVRATVGLLPEATRAARLSDTKRCADFAHEVGAQNVSSHIGYIPEDRADPTYGALVSALQEICDYIQRREMNF